MPALLSISVGLVLADVLLAWIFESIHAKEPSPHLRLWALAWLADAGASVAGSAMIIARGGGALLEGVAAFAVLGQSLLLMRGTTEFAARPMGRGWWIAAPLSIVCAGVMKWLGVPWPLPMFAPMAFLALATAWTGITVLRAADMSGGGAWMPGIALVLLGVNYFDFPLLGSHVRLAPWGMMVTLMLRVAIGAGFLMLHFDRARDGLKASEGRYKSLFEDAIEGVFRTRVDGTILDANPAFARILGYASPAELIGRNAEGFYADPADRRRLAAQSADGTTLEATELSWRRKDKKQVTVQLYGRSIRDDLGRTLHYQGFVRDITEARQLEQQLFQAQRMETVGRLAGGVAHDFNNLLTVIGASADMIANEGGRSAELAKGIGEATERAAALTKQLLTFAGRERRKPRVVSIAPIVTGLVGILERTLGKSIVLHLETPEEELYALADPAQVEQVVMNLVLNARDAIAGEGRVDIRVAREAGGAAHEDPGACVMLEVHDSGDGIDDVTLPHIFEPFYTTKGPGRGTGLGLATVYAIATQSGGRVEVESEQGRGTTFRFYLPEAQPAVQREQDKEQAPSATVRASVRGTVLLVEDEPAVRNVARRILEAARYAVITVESGADAVACAQRDTPFDVLLTDVVMPGLDGPHTAAEVLRLRPGVGVVFMSGYPERLEASPWVQDLDARFLAKPFAAADLVAIIDMCGARQGESAQA